MNLIDAALNRSRTTLILLLILFYAGFSAYLSIPKESEPDINIPNIYVSVSHEGISPGDAERLLVRPLEQELQSIEGLKEITATAAEGFASVSLEFDAGFDADSALRDVREAVDIARPQLPDDSEEPRVTEFSVAMFPVLTAVLSGPIPEAKLVAIARDLQDEIEAIPGVLEVEIGGNREEVVDVIIDPLVMETYNLSADELFSFIRNNNRLVAAGTLDTGAGRFSIKVPGIIENIDDIMNMPVKVDGDRVIKVSDIAEINFGFKDPDGFARVDGEVALSLEVSKRVGANIIETVESVRAVIAEHEAHWPVGLHADYLLDKSDAIRDTLTDLQNNVVAAVVLVMIVIVLALGLRPAMLVGVAIPGSFLAGILVIQMLGYTLNMVTLFSLILVVGMLVDGAIVVVELADRNMREGQSPRAAYAAAAKRMSWPVIASSATTLAVFFPLLFWPGMVGEFMKYLPITVIACLSASLAMALIFVPVLGATMTRSSPEATAIAVPDKPGRYITMYQRFLHFALRRPGIVLIATLLGTFVIYFSFGAFGKGLEFFPEQEPEYAQVHVRARGDLSVWEKDTLVRSVESKLIGLAEVESVYARTLGSNNGSGGLAKDVVGTVQLKFIDWQQRRPATEILKDVRSLTAGLPGVIVEARTEGSGLTSGKPIEIQISNTNPDLLAETAASIRTAMENLGGLVDIEDDRALPATEWRVTVDRAEAARFGANVASIGNAIKLVTNGIKLTDYRPASSDDEVDIRLRFDDANRHIGEIESLRLLTLKGLVPISNFVTIEPAQKTDVINRSGGKRLLTVKADVEEGQLVSERINALRTAFESTTLPVGSRVSFKGQDEDQAEAMNFLVNAFLAAIALMTLLLVTQFNSIYHAMLVLSAIVFSTGGVLLGLLVMQHPFGVVMSGIGVIALAGIVVNNNIILIDTFNEYRRQGLDAFAAAIETGSVRARPVLLTAVTTILGLLPMVFGINFNFLTREVTIGAPSTQLWTQLASSIAGGLAVATVLTLVLTPCLLVLGEQFGQQWSRSLDRIRTGLLRNAQPVAAVKEVD